ncbi:MAG: LamG domain-containing protein, partial [Planctomycetes bacterium]|nr:LamG domain-containing protein [Planctomycetota bacterium]
MNWNGRAVIYILILSFLLRSSYGREVDLPYRIDPNAEPEPNGTTLLLWRFEKGKASDSTVGSNNGHLTGKAQTTQGRHGTALKFDGKSAITVKNPADSHIVGGTREGVSYIVDFWIRIPEAPAKDVCVLQMSRGPRFHLNLTPKLHFQLRGDALENCETKQPVPAESWFHVALLRRHFVQPNRIYGDQSGIELLINGASAGVAWDAEKHRSAGTDKLFVSLGNSTGENAGFTGSMDEFRISMGAAGIYRLFDQTFPGAESRESVTRSKEYFRHLSRQVYCEIFSEDALERIRPPEKTRYLTTAPPVVPVTGGGEPAADLLGDDGMPDLATDMEEQMHREEKGTASPVKPIDGVGGGAVLIRGGEARLDLPKNTHLPNGTLEFWFKPVNWDNLATPPGRHETWSYTHRRTHVLTLWGMPREGKGAPRPLVMLKQDRADGALAVRPKYRKHFERPRLPIVPHRWRHVTITWSDRFAHLLGCWVDGTKIHPTELARPETWQSHNVAYITFGNEWATCFDELQIYGYPFEEIERKNARASYTEEDLQPLASATSRRVITSLGKFPVNTGSSKINRIAGAWLKGWVTGTNTEGPAKVFFGFRPSIGKMIVAVAPVNPLDIEKVKSAEVQFNLPHKPGEVSGTIPKFAHGKGGVVLDVGNLPVGTYNLTGVLRRDDGKTLAEFRSRFQRVSYPSVDCTLGLPDKPAPPFTPVTVTDECVQTVGRTYTVARDGNFNSIVVRGEEILASPAEFVAMKDKKPVTLKGSGAKFGKTRPTATSWQATGSGAGLKITSNAKVEYDGLTKYDIKVAPAAKSAKIDGLSLKIALKADYAKLFHVLGPNSGLRNPYVTGVLRPGNGRVWDSQNDAPFLPRYLPS